MSHSYKWARNHPYVGIPFRGFAKVHGWARHRTGVSRSRPRGGAATPLPSGSDPQAAPPVHAPRPDAALPRCVYKLPRAAWKPRWRTTILKDNEGQVEAIVVGAAPGSGRAPARTCVTPGAPCRFRGVGGRVLGRE